MMDKQSQIIFSDIAFYTKNDTVSRPVESARPLEAFTARRLENILNSEECQIARVSLKCLVRRYG